MQSRDSLMSPKRSSRVKKVEVDLEVENQRLRVELEHHKNMLIGLNEKMTVFNDVRQDLETHRYMLGEATDARSNL